MSMTAAEIGAYQNQRTNARTAYENYLAQNVYNRGKANVDYTNHYNDLQHSISLGRENLPGGYNQRGLLDSGIYGRALGNFGYNANQQIGNLVSGYQNQNAQFDFGAQNAASQMNNTLSQIDQSQAARQADIAAQLRGMA